MRPIFRRKREDESDEINISPLIDMVFILLIFFVITASFSRDSGVEVNKPEAATAKTLHNENIMIAVTSEGTFHILEKQVDEEQLEVIVRRLAGENPGRSVLIMVDRDAPSGRVVDAIDICNLSGVKKVNIAAVKK